VRALLTGCGLAVAIFVSPVESSVNQHLYKIAVRCFGIPKPIEVNTELAPPSRCIGRERIIVFHPSPHIYPSLQCFSHKNGIDIYIYWLTSHRGAWANIKESRPFRIGSQIRKADIIWIISSTKKTCINMVEGIPSWSLPSVIPYWSYSPPCYFVVVVNKTNFIVRARFNISAQLATLGAFHSVNSLPRFAGLSDAADPRSDPQTNGGASQDSRKYCDPEREKCIGVFRRPLPEGFAAMTFWLVGVIFAAGLCIVLGVTWWGLRQLSQYRPDKKRR